MSTGESPSEVPIWLRPEPQARSARFSRDQIADKAMEIADAEGFPAVSMRRVATELGAGTMTLYHYVSSKTELRQLMDDRMMGELLIDEASVASGDWRRGLTEIAWQSLRTFRRHRWLLNPERVNEFGPSPNGMRHFEQSMRVAASTGLPGLRQLEIVSQIDDYVFGFAIGDEDLDVDDAKWDERLSPLAEYVDREIQAGNYPTLSGLLAGDDLKSFFRRVLEESTPDDRFTRGLARLLDGVQLEIDRGAGSA